MVADIIKGHLSNDQRVTGKTINSYEVIVLGSRLRILGAGHALTLDDGRPPTRGTGTSGQPSLFSAILQWVKDKGISPAGRPPRKRGERKGEPYSLDDLQRSLAGAITQVIHTQGTKIYRDKTPTGVIRNVITEQRIQILLDALGEKNMQLISGEVLRGLKPE